MLRIWNRIGMRGLVDTLKAPVTDNVINYGERKEARHGKKIFSTGILLYQEQVTAHADEQKDRLREKRRLPNGLLRQVQVILAR
jgi:hypothetical protein